jgi:two-component system OmpR family response regulator
MTKISEAEMPSRKWLAAPPRDRARSSSGGKKDVSIKIESILVVDDDPTMLEMLTSYFVGHGGVRVSLASTGAEVRRQLSDKYPSLILLDLQLGKDDGLDLLRAIRAYSDVPVIIITAHRLDDGDRVIGLELGADDYVAKPFQLRELLARIRAVLRRHEMGRATRARRADSGGYRFGGWQLQRRGRRLVDPTGTTVRLSASGYALLLAFLEAPQRPLSRDQLLQATRRTDDIFDRSIDIQVLRLRRKLEINANDPCVIRTVRGVGYLFSLPVEPF